MEIRFANEVAAEIFKGVSSKKSRKALPLDLHRSGSASSTSSSLPPTFEALHLPHGNMLEALKGDREGQHCIRINGKYRICFVMTEQGATQIKIVDYH